MDTFPHQLTHDFVTLEREFARISRELTRFLATNVSRTDAVHISDRIRTFHLPVAEWDTMERELHHE